MKTMQNFAAQQLTKKQMNDVKGGYTPTPVDKCGTLYSVTWSGGTSYVCSTNTAEMKHFQDMNADFVRM